MRPSDLMGRGTSEMLSRHIGCQIDLGNIRSGMPGAVDGSSSGADSGAPGAVPGHHCNPRSLTAQRWGRPGSRSEDQHCPRLWLTAAHRGKVTMRDIKFSWRNSRRLSHCTAVQRSIVCYGIRFISLK